MSFNGFKSVIQEGDKVVVYVSATQYHVVSAVPKTLSKKGVLIDNVYQTNYGALRCGDLVGKEFGAKIQLPKGYIFVLQPTPELWTLSLPHRTQIIYTPDISMIILQLELRPGSVVIESGTGSGSLSHALIRTVKPYGHLYTFDFHEIRANTARDEFNLHGLKDFVTVEHRDVCADGFGDDLDKKADAVFLDLPHPWEAIPHAVKSVKEKGGRLCSFSPCIEQVQKSCTVLRELGCQEIETMEVLQTQYMVVNRNLNSLNLDFVKTVKGGTAGSVQGSSTGNVQQDKEVVKVVAAVPPNTQPGHTGFLTFATVMPIWVRGNNVTDVVDSV